MFNNPGLDKIVNNNPITNIDQLYSIKDLSIINLSGVELKQSQFYWHLNAR